jgi:acetolactate synthase-1/2/3 large subunit
MEMETHYIDLSTGARLFVVTEGSGDELVVFLHPVGGDHRNWKRQIHALSSRYTAAAFDLRGHGRSPISGEHIHFQEQVDVGLFARDTVALIEALGFRKAHLVGQSMGGVVALETFRQRASIVQSLVLANSWASHPRAEAHIGFVQEQLGKMRLPEIARMRIPPLLAPGTPAAIVEEAIEIEGSKDPQVFLASWVSMFQQDYRGMLELIDVPLLLIGGTLDVLTPADPLLTAIHAAVPMSRLAVIDGASHFSNLDHPGEFNELLAAHLRGARGAEPMRILPRQPRKIELDSLTLGQGFVQLLAQRGIRYLFANSGIDAAPVVDGLARLAESEKISLTPILVPHENTAVAMAHGFYLMAGEPQAVMADGNVGTANLVLGAINAARSRIPMLLLAGRAPADSERTHVAQWGQQAFDPAAAVRECVKWSSELRGAGNLESVVDRALAIAQSDPAGPVFLTLPKEALEEPVHGLSVASEPRQRPSARAVASCDALERAADWIHRAQRPLIITAELGRYRGGPEALVHLAQREAIPVIEHGKRNFFNFPTDHPMHLGFSPSPFVEQADLMIAVECPVPWIPAVSELSEIPPMIQIGVDPLASQIPGRAFPADLALAGDPALILRALSLSLEKRRRAADSIAKRFDALSSEHRRVQQQARSQAIADASRQMITKRYLSYCIGQTVDDDCVIFNEHSLESQLVRRSLPDSWFESSLAAGLGWSLGAALGARLAAADKTMVVALGDGSYFFNTPTSANYIAAANQLPILVIVFNDSGWSVIRNSYGGGKRKYPLSDLDPVVQFERVAEACGGIGLRVEQPSEVLPVLRRALQLVREERRHVLVNAICQSG